MYFDVLHVHISKYCGGIEILVKIIKNAGGGWQLFSKTLVEKELIVFWHFSISI